MINYPINGSKINTKYTKNNTNNQNIKIGKKIDKIIKKIVFNDKCIKYKHKNVEYLNNLNDMKWYERWYKIWFIW